MNQEMVEDVLRMIKTSTDRSAIIRDLTKLRTNLVKDRDGIILFRKSGGVMPMVRFLSKPHEKILEIVLSILGNCCTEEICCEEALEHKVIASLTTILKAVSNPLIQNRACRLLGNLAKFSSTQVLATHCSVIAQALCHIIDTSDVPNRIMAYRACRFLSRNSQFIKHFFESNGLHTMLSILATLMKNDEEIMDEPEKLLKDVQISLRQGLKHNEHREKYFEEVARNLEGVRSDIFDYAMLKNKSPDIIHQYKFPVDGSAIELLCEILKCLLEASEYEISAKIWDSLNRDNCTLKPIVYLVRDNSHYRSIALKILSNIAKLPGAFYILSSSDAIFAACELVTSKKKSKSQLSNSEIRHCINIISILSTDACNRSKIRRSGTLKELIHLLRDSQSFHDKNSILYVFINFQYDSMSMDLMLREGLVGVLIHELNQFISSDNDYYKQKREERLRSSKKRKAEELCNDSVSKFPKIRDNRIVLDYDSPSSSPVIHGSPCSSRSFSPVANNLYTNNNSDEEAYSPVCSDDDDDDDDNNGGDNDDDNMDDCQLIDDNNDATDNNENENSTICTVNLLDVGTRSQPIDNHMQLDGDDDDEVSKDTSITRLLRFGNLPHNAIDIIDNLLFRVTCLMKKSADLGKTETMCTLIRAISLFGPNVDFIASLTNILLESQFFGQVIRHGIPHQVFQLTKINEMKKDAKNLMDTLTSVGECNYGKEELSRLLRCTNPITQKEAAISIAYIVKNKQLLYNFLNEGNALSILLDIILSKKQDEFPVQAIDALTCMARNSLGIHVPSIDSVNSIDTYEPYIDNKDESLHSDCDIRFVVHSTPTKKDNSAPVFVEFNKALLCSISEVFNTMLNSDFREGNEGEIHLRTYSAVGLRYFLNLIVRHSLEHKMNLPSADQSHLLLEAFEMSRVYIIPELENQILDMLILRLNDSNCLHVFEWSMRNYHQELSENVVNYYLCCTLESKNKLALFHTADYSDYSTQWFEIILQIIYTKSRVVNF